MSVEALAIALHHSRCYNATQLAVLIGIANHDGDGGSWPTVKTLAHYARVKDRAVQTALSELEKLGEVRRDVQGGGTAEIAHYDRPNLYHFLLTCPPHCDRSKNHKLLCQGCRKPLPKSFQLTPFHPQCDPKHPVSSATPGAARDTGGVSSAAPKPSLEPTTRLNEEPHVLDRAREAHNVDGSAEPLAVVAAAPEEDGSAGSHRGDTATESAPASSTPDPLPAVSDSSDICPRWPALNGPHAFNVKSGVCVDCNAIDPDWANPETGEIA